MLASAWTIRATDRVHAGAAPAAVRGVDSVLGVIGFNEPEAHDLVVDVQLSLDIVLDAIDGDGADAMGENQFSDPTTDTMDRLHWPSSPIVRLGSLWRLTPDGVTRRMCHVTPIDLRLWPRSWVSCRHARGIALILFCSWEYHRLGSRKKQA